MSEDARGVFKRAFSRFATPTKEYAPAELPAERVSSDCTPVSEVRARSHVAVTGTLRTVTLRPRAGLPALVAELHDGSGAISLVWLGRRQIPGVDAGRRMTCYGRVARDGDQAVIFNPRYELRPAGAE